LFETLTTTQRNLVPAMMSDLFYILCVEKVIHGEKSYAKSDQTGQAEMDFQK